MSPSPRSKRASEAARAFREAGLPWLAGVAEAFGCGDLPIDVCPVCENDLVAFEVPGMGRASRLACPTEGCPFLLMVPTGCAA